MLKHSVTSDSFISLGEKLLEKASGRTYHPGLMMLYLPSTDRSTTVDPRRLWSPIGPPSTTTASLGQSSWNSLGG